MILSTTSWSGDNLKPSRAGASLDFVGRLFFPFFFVVVVVVVVDIELDVVKSVGCL